VCTSVAALMFERNEYLFKFHLKSGYYHVDIHPECHELLSFQWRDSFYVFKVLPFGLSSACYLFTKLLRPLIRLWRSRGLKAIVYLDDGVVAVKGKDKAAHESAIVRKDLERAGFVVNIDKSQWIPSQEIEWLGFTINLSKDKDKAAHESAIVREDVEHAGFVVNIDKSQWIPSQEIEWLGFTINLSKGKDKAAHESAIVREDLEHAGFVVNINKSQWIPSQEIEWLGFTINLSKGEFSVQDSKLNRLRQKFFELNRVELVGAKQIASVEVQ